jgi:hypothetical protein
MRAVQATNNGGGEREEASRTIACDCFLPVSTILKPHPTTTPRTPQTRPIHGCIMRMSVGPGVDCVGEVSTLDSKLVNLTNSFLLTTLEPYQQNTIEWRTTFRAAPAAAAAAAAPPHPRDVCTAGHDPCLHRRHRMLSCFMEARAVGSA